ncbi:hypothetical protein [Collinsella aerofaciens]|uniref:hypothetical protein n=1 Tax=Collinsella aerofaciens TaxID=74426 RepID=UPI00189B2EA4|nr:hypothetical protein [Collinsella aerofaciens]MDB1846690.1 hypothetical protein [Collinsella aerofaciens]MDB1848787.1 hypothetical protein [Collinsella aerofaciens]MDB1853960.1 hypothetical protein [Collinsella aerofaciens]
MANEEGAPLSSFGRAAGWPSSGASWPSPPVAVGLAKYRAIHARRSSLVLEMIVLSFIIRLAHSSATSAAGCRLARSRLYTRKPRRSL